MQIMTAIAGFLGILITLVILHEFGHYLAARKYGVIPRSFSIGMGPEVAAFEDRHGTRWKFCMFPIGGYVKFKGEMHPDGTKDSGDFAQLSRGKRSIVIAAGPMMNLAIAVVLFLGIALTQGIPVTDRTVIAVEKGSPADSAGIIPGDKIIQWNGEKMPDMRKMMRRMKIEANAVNHITLLRGSSQKEVALKSKLTRYRDQFGNESRIGKIGIELQTKVEPVSSLNQIFNVSVIETKEILHLQIKSIAQIVTGERSIQEISGPVRMAKTSGEQLTIGWRNYLYFAAIVSIAIAFMNLLPVPGLDGGFLAIYVFEALKGENIRGDTIKNMMVTGYIAVGALAAFAFYNDINVILGD